MKLITSFPFIIIQLSQQGPTHTETTPGPAGQEQRLAWS